MGCSGLEIGSDLIGLGVGRLCLLARVVDARLRVPADLLALGDRLVGLRHGLVGGLLRVLRGHGDAARVHERQLITILVDAIRAILRAIANDDVRAARAGDAHGAHLVGLLGQGEAHGLHAQAQAERRIVWIQFHMRGHCHLQNVRPWDPPWRRKSSSLCPIGRRSSA